MKIKFFIFSKDHNIKYICHTYYRTKICVKKLLNNGIKKEEWENEDIRISLFKYYFSINIDSTEENCKLFFKQYLKDLFIINDKIEKEIKKCKFSSTHTNKSYSSIYDKLIYLKDNNKDEICYLVKYEHFNKIKKK